MTPSPRTNSMGIVRFVVYKIHNINELSYSMSLSNQTRDKCSKNTQHVKQSYVPNKRAWRTSVNVIPTPGIY